MTTTSRRQGGRAARKALRAAPLAEDLRPVRSGMTGGSYAPLSAADCQNIHQAALQILEEIGLADAPQSGVEILTGAGALLGDDGRIRFPRALVEDMLAKYQDNIDEIGLRFLASHMCYDISKAKTELGYQPSMTTEDAIRETALWAAGHLKLA